MRRGSGVAIGFVLLLALARGASAQVSLPTGPATAAPADEATEIAEDGGEARVGLSENPISVDQKVGDEELTRSLHRLLGPYPGVRSADVRVENGIVEIDGHVATAEVRDAVTQFARRVEGVRLVVNRMRTDQQVLSATELLSQTVGGLWHRIERGWLVWLAAFSLVAATLLLARTLSLVWDPLLRPFVRRELMRAVVASVLNVLIVGGGLLLALSTLELTQAVLSLVGVAGIVGLTLGFAFRDIAENFIASLLLGFRRPFRSGDLVEIAGQLGVVRAMNTRATVLVTLQGNHVRIPNATIFKEVLINRTAAPQTRDDATIDISHATSIQLAMTTIAAAAAAHAAVLKEPQPQAYVEMIDPGFIRLRLHWWYNAREIDPIRLKSDVLLAVRVALAGRGIEPPMTELGVYVKTQAPPDVVTPRADVAEPPPARALEADRSLAERSAWDPDRERSDRIAHGLPADVLVGEGEDLLEEDEEG